MLPEIIKQFGNITELEKLSSQTLVAVIMGTLYVGFKAVSFDHGDIFHN